MYRPRSDFLIEWKNLFYFRSTELAKMSGLSGISDIIGDMVAKGEIDLEDAGLTQREADRLVKRGAIR